jgi:hypothetical protein
MKFLQAQTSAPAEAITDLHPVSLVILNADSSASLRNDKEYTANDYTL